MISLTLTREILTVLRIVNVCAILLIVTINLMRISEGGLVSLGILAKLTVTGPVNVAVCTLPSAKSNSRGSLPNAPSSLTISLNPTVLALLSRAPLKSLLSAVPSNGALRMAFCCRSVISDAAVTKLFLILVKLSRNP